VTVAIALSAAVALGLGVGFLSILWPPTAVPRSNRWLLVSLGSGLGLGITAIALFCWMLPFGSPGGALLGVELAVLTLLVLRIRRGNAWRALAPAPGPSAPPVRSERIVAGAFALTLACAAAAFVGLSASRPHGAWDAWMNWNLRARMIFRAGEAWQVAFSPLLPWSHPDYPLLVQFSVVRTWIYNGAESLAGPATVAFLFTFGTVGLATAGLAALRDRTQGMLAGLTLLATPFLIFHGTSQYGDVPVGFFFLATLVLLALHDRHRGDTNVFAMLAGLTTGLAGWTKNEGLLFLIAILLAGLLTVRAAGGVRRSAREAVPFLVGLLPALALIAFFKLRLAPANDLMSTVGAGETLARLTEVQRYLAVARGFALQIATFGFNGLISAVPLLAVYGACVGVRAEELRTRWFRLTVWIVVLILTGHAIVVVATAADAARLVNSSLERLLLQLWPGVVFVCFRVFRSPVRGAQVETESALPAANAAA
jgi:hypothetical protein